MADNTGFTKFVARNKIGQGKGGKPAPMDTKRTKHKPKFTKSKVGPTAKASVGWPGEGGQRNVRADYIRNVRNMRRQGGKFGSGEGGVIGPYSPRVETGGAGSERRKRFNRA